MSNDWPHGTANPYIVPMRDINSNAVQQSNNQFVHQSTQFDNQNRPKQLIRNSTHLKTPSFTALASIIQTMPMIQSQQQNNQYTNGKYFYAPSQQQMHFINIPNRRRPHSTATPIMPHYTNNIISEQPRNHINSSAIRIETSQTINVTNIGKKLPGSQFIPKKTSQEQPKQESPSCFAEPILPIITLETIMTERKHIEEEKIEIKADVQTCALQQSPPVKSQTRKTKLFEEENLVKMALVVVKAEAPLKTDSSRKKQILCPNCKSSTIKFGQLLCKKCGIKSLRPHVPTVNTETVKECTKPQIEGPLKQAEPQPTHRRVSSNSLLPKGTQTHRQVTTKQLRKRALSSIDPESPKSKRKKT
jgi:hypothetical protein